MEYGLHVEKLAKRFYEFSWYTTSNVLLDFWFKIYFNSFISKYFGRKLPIYYSN